MRALGILAVILLFSGTAFADNGIDLSSVNIINASIIKNNGVDANISVQNVTGSQITYTLSVITGNTEYYRISSLTVDANQTATYSIHTANFLTAGVYDLNFVITNNAFPSNQTLGTNLQTKQIQVFNGVNLKAVSVDVNSGFSAQPGQTIIVNGNYANIGDVPATIPFNIALIVDGNVYAQQSISFLNTGAFAQFTIPITLSTVPHVNDIALSVDANGAIGETDEQNNITHTSVTTISGADLSVSDFDINVSDINKGSPTTVNFAVRNTGDTTINDVPVAVYFNTVTQSAILYTKVIPTIPSGGLVVSSFAFTPTTVGLSKVIVFADYTNVINESSENNNQGQKSFLILSQAQADSNFTANIISVDIQKNCIALLSNNDRLIADDIDANSVKLRMVDSANNEILNRTFVGQQTATIPGVTLNVINIIGGIAKVFLVYQNNVTLVYNSCVVDFNTFQAQVLDYQNKLEACNISVAEKGSELTLARSDVVVANTNYSTNKTALESCDKAKLEGEINFQRVNQGCDARVSNVADTKDMLYQNIITQNNNDYNKTMTMLESERDSSNFTANVAFATLGLAILGIGGFFFYKKAIHEGSLGT